MSAISASRNLCKEMQSSDQAVVQLREFADEAVDQTLLILSFLPT